MTDTEELEHGCLSISRLLRQRAAYILALLSRIEADAKAIAERDAEIARLKGALEASCSLLRALTGPDDAIAKGVLDLAIAALTQEGEADAG